MTVFLCHPVHALLLHKIR